MSVDRGPLDTYRVTWDCGDVEYVQAHQVIHREGWWMIHAEIDGRWKLLLSAPAEDVRSVRNVTRCGTAGGES